MSEILENNQPHIVLMFQGNKTNVLIFENKKCLDEFIKIKQKQIRNSSELISFDPFQLRFYMFYSLDKFYKLEIKDHLWQPINSYSTQIYADDYEHVLRKLHKSRIVDYKKHTQLKELIDQYTDKWFKENLHEENTYPDW